MDYDYYKSCLLAFTNFNFNIFWDLIPVKESSVLTRTPCTVNVKQYSSQHNTICSVTLCLFNLLWIFLTLIHFKPLSYQLGSYFLSCNPIRYSSIWDLSLSIWIWGGDTVGISCSGKQVNGYLLLPCPCVGVKRSDRLDRGYPPPSNPIYLTILLHSQNGM